MHCPVGTEPVIDALGHACSEWFEEPVTPPPPSEAHAMSDLSDPGFVPDSVTRLKEWHKQKKLTDPGYYARLSKKRKYAFGSKSLQEVQARLNQASRLTLQPKWLDEATQERTGLELNPLWMLETLIRSGILSKKDQLVALGVLAEYAHSKALTVSLTKVGTSEPLLSEIAALYPVVEVEARPYRKHGTSPTYEKDRKRHQARKARLVAEGYGEGDPQNA